MSAYDYYGEARALAEALRNAGLSSDGNDIIKSLEEGETGTEIFMIMRARLAKLLAAGRLSPELQGRAHALHERLNDALN